MLRTVLRFSIRALALVFVLGVFWSGYLWVQAGQLRQLKELQSPGECIKVEVPGPEDIDVHRGEAIAFISSDDRTIAEKSRPDGAIYSYDLRAESPELLNLTADLEPPFHPHGIYLLEGVSASVLYVINHTGEEHLVEIFDWESGRLAHRKTVRDPLLRSPNDLAAMTDGTFFVTNDHGSGSELGKTVEDFLRLERSNVVYWDGAQMRVVYEGLAYANGIELSSDESELFVASTSKGRILRFEVGEAGSLDLLEEIKLGTGVDNLERDLHGFLWVAAHPHLFTFLGHARNPSKRSPSEGLWVSPTEPTDPEAPRVRPAFLTDGEELSGSSVLVPFGSRFLIGSVFEPHFLVCERS